MRLFDVAAQQQLCGCVQDRLAVEPMVAIKVEEIARLPKMLGAERADAVPANAAQPTERGRGAVEYRYQSRLGGERGK